MKFFAGIVLKKEFCGLWDSAQTDDYTIYNNLWGAHDDPKGGQCTGLDSVDGSTVAWHTSFNWNGSFWQVKSFANAALKFDPVQLSDVKSIPSTIEYDYKYDSKIITNVAYDLFTSATTNGTVEYELMVWLAALGGAWPLTTSGRPIKEVNVGNVDFNLYQGKNGNTTAFSYVAVNTTTKFSADFKSWYGTVPRPKCNSHSLQVLNRGKSSLGSSFSQTASPSVADKEFCGRENSTQTEDYILYNNLWGAFDDPKGSQCTGLDSVDGSKIAWHTSFNWNGTAWQVKSFSNAALKFDYVPIANVTSIPSTIEFDFDYEGKVVANVAYDLFTTPELGTNAEFDVMVWLAAFGGAGPLSNTGSAIKHVTVGRPPWAASTSVSITARTAT